MGDDRFDACAHSSQAVAFAGDGVLAIVLNDQAAMTCFCDEAEAAVCGAGMANDIGYGLAQDQGKSGFFLRAEGCGVCGVAFSDECDACGMEREARGFNLGGKAAGAIASDGFTNLGKGTASCLFDVGHLGSGANGVNVDEAAREFSF